MDILLIQPRLPNPKGKISGLEGSMVPLTLLYLAKPLLEKGFDVDILDLTVYNINARYFKDYIEIIRPTVVGITCFTGTFSSALKTAEYVKSVDPEITVVIGGVHVTFVASEALENKCIDIVVRGEGDINFPQLAEHYIYGKYSLAEINGISYRQDGEIKETPRKIISDIDTLSFPPRDIIDLSRYHLAGSIQVSRGCPFKCRFCAASAMAGGKYRVRSIQNILEEIDYLVRRIGCRDLLFQDDTLTGFPEVTKALCQYIIRKEYPIHWFCESRVDIVDKDILSLMARAGCTTIQFGFESGSQKILNSMGKNISLRNMEAAVRCCLDTGIQPVGNFLIGFPEDTKETIRETVEMNKKLRRMGASTNIGIVVPFPGTYYYNHAEELGLTIHASDWEEYELEVPIVSTRNFTRDELKEIWFDSISELQHYY